ncbi:hypothetical protein [Oerskovia douganii]|nr:hypothetical protein [Oerskovia douganii]
MTRNVPAIGNPTTSSRGWDRGPVSAPHTTSSVERCFTLSQDLAPPR